MKNYFAMTKEEVLSKLNSKETGLKTCEVEIAIEKYGYNQLNAEKKLCTMQVFRFYEKLFCYDKRGGTE